MPPTHARHQKDPNTCVFFKCQWFKRVNEIDEGTPTCVQRLMQDSAQRQEQKVRDELVKEERDRKMEEMALKMAARNRFKTGKAPSKPNFAKFIQD